MEAEVERLERDIAGRVEQVRSKIRGAAQQSGRSESDVLLLAATKTHPPEVIRVAHSAGVRHFGENRVEEAEDKIKTLDSLDGVVWHLVGHLQSRKSARAAQLFSWVHSADSVKVATKLSEAVSSIGKTVKTLLQVNLSGEESKSGFDLSRWPGDTAQEAKFFRSIEAVAQLNNLEVCGLMTIPPYDDNPEMSRPVFSHLRSLRDKLSTVFPSLRWEHLSMGMSADFEIAIQEGATIVRLGTILFGSRDTAKR